MRHGWLRAWIYVCAIGMIDSDMLEKGRGWQTVDARNGLGRKDAVGLVRVGRDWN